ncbi:hypothetical protein PO909_010388, partial [Leuciscus waleckii]
NFALSPEVQLLAALRFFATGSFIEVVGEGYGLSKTSVWRCVHTVTNALLRHAGDYIRLPATCQEVQEVHQGGHAIAGIPRVLGLVDGTLIPIANPSVIDHIGEGAYTGFPFRCFASCIALRVVKHTDNVHYKQMSLCSLFKQAFGPYFNDLKRKCQAQSASNFVGGSWALLLFSRRDKCLLRPAQI